MSRQRLRLDSGHWFGKTCAGTLLGLGLALAGSGLIAGLTPGGIAGGQGKWQFTMWLIVPLWVGVLGGVHLFRTSLRAWLWLGAANLIGFGALWLLRGWQA
jgi:hypothetical protein